MWRVIACSVRGTSHLRSGLPCQDYSSFLHTYFESEKVTIVGIADGAGSSKASDIGSMEAVEHILRRIATWPKRIGDIGEEQAKTWVEESRQQLDLIATTKQLELRDLSCTLLVAILGDAESVFFQVGDGAWIAEYQGTCEVITWPRAGEYANETTFITSPKWEENLQFRRWTDSAMSFAGFTDGVQSLALHFASKSVHAPFFAPMFSVLHSTDDETSLIAPLHGFLDSPEINERTDDDKTLTLACRERKRLTDAPD